MFSKRHNGPNAKDISAMCSQLGVKNLTELSQQTVPESIRFQGELDLPKALTEDELLHKAGDWAIENHVARSFIGTGYYGTFTPSVILRNILENPGWYTAYTPYQAEISQGRMEALLNFQTMVMDLTGMDISNASLLDEGTAAAEAMTLALSLTKSKSTTLFVDEDIFPQTKELLNTRSEALGIQLEFGSIEKLASDQMSKYYGVYVQNPGFSGEIRDLTKVFSSLKSHNVFSIVGTDLLSLCLMKSPGEMGADIVIGSTQRFGVPFGFGGPHAAYLATKDAFKRQMPGRIIGVSQDAHGRPALRLALQTREQHIRREKATSNICTAQVLLAVMAGMYAVYHGPQGLTAIAQRVFNLASSLKATLQKMGLKSMNNTHFDTLTYKIESSQKTEILKRSKERNLNLGLFFKDAVQICMDETTKPEELEALVYVLTGKSGAQADVSSDHKLSQDLNRTSEILSHKVFNIHHSESEMLRYIHRLQAKDLSLVHSMIPLGSCTMKLNATTEMMPVTWPKFSQIHPFAPLDQAKGYVGLIKELEGWLCEITGFAAMSLQPNAGSQGEYAGLLVIRKYHQSRGDEHRNICLIPSSAHGTNPASAVMAGFKVIVTACDNEGNVDIADLKAKAELHKNNLGALMVTYPSTHGVFEEGFREICDIIHKNGGQVYMDGANMNAMVGLCKPGKIGADVSHLNLHKTFCIPHGGGGPGVGPIGVAEHLKNFIPTHSLVPQAGPKDGISAVSSAPWGSAGILPISWAYIAMMGADGLKEATQIAILNANYIASRLKDHYDILYSGKNGRVAHECIVDCRSFKASADVGVDDIAKRLMDYGFHAPTMSWPVTGTLMIEPTESESKEELDRFIDAMISIRKEIKAIEDGKSDKLSNLLKNAPHSYHELMKDDWSHKYTREQAGFPLPWVRDRKFWVPVSRVDNVYGDKNLVCSCLPLEAYQ